MKLSMSELLCSGTILQEALTNALAKDGAGLVKLVSGIKGKAAGCKVGMQVHRPISLHCL